MRAELYIIGSGGLGREVLATLNATGFTKSYSKLYFIDNQEGSVKGVQIIGKNEYLMQIDYPVDVLIAISNCKVREKIISEMENKENLNFITFIHPNSSIYNAESVFIGKGCYISESTILTTDISIGDFCFLNVNVSLHHDTVIEKNCFLMPGVRITGGATIGENTFIGNNFQIATKSSIPPFSNLTN